MLEPAWIDTALSLTGGFETAGDPFEAVAADFDGEGLSCGALQWNIGQGTLQPLVIAAGRDAVLREMPEWGEDFWNAVQASIPDGMAMVRYWQQDGLNSRLKQELQCFLGCDEMRDEQRKAAGSIAVRAYRAAQGWAKARGDVLSKKEFCWFFDLVTQNGGLKGVGLAQVHAFLRPSAERACDAICDWLTARRETQFGYRDALKNAAEWRGRVGESDLDLFALSYLRALKARVVSQPVVMNRRATLAAGHGWVNGHFFALDKALA